MGPSVGALKFDGAAGSPGAFGDSKRSLTKDDGAPYWNPPLEESQICITTCEVLKKACASFASPSPAAASMAAAPTASPPPPSPARAKTPPSRNVAL